MTPRAPLHPPFAPRPRNSRGFTMIELMITLSVLAVVMIVLTTVMYTAARSKTATSNRIESAQASRVAVDMMTRDIRSAGYGADLDEVGSPQPAIAYVDSMELLLNANIEPYPDTTLQRVPPLAYNPAGNPQPKPLQGTSWTPPKKYESGAELIRWTLDTDNNGLVNGDDVATTNGLDAQRTANPNDFVLVREVYGDSVGNVAGNNGPARTERVALIRKPGGTVPPIFTVYFKGNSTPWNWASGPVPPGQLADIERVDISVVAPSAKPDHRGKFAETKIETQVYAIRNVPNFGAKEFAVDGYIFDDQNEDGDKDPGEPGLNGVGVSLGFLSTTTNAAGYFLFSATAGTYTLKHVPPANYGISTAPDSFVVTIGPGVSRSFADTVIAGGWVTCKVYEDLDNDNVHDASEPWREDEVVTLTPANKTETTDSNGQAMLFAPVGAYTITLAVPDSFVCTTSNPVAGTMINGGTATYEFALARQDEGHIKGLVWQDKNGNGAVNGGEGGVADVWVGVRQFGAATTVTFGYTAGDGKFDLTVPANDPPATTPYIVEIIPPSGYYPTTSTEIGGVYLAKGATVSNQNFGINNFQKIVLNSARVLSLASGDMIEKDWTGNKTGDARRDAELILGADAAGSDQLSVWFNLYNGTPIFTPNRSYSRSAPNSVLCLAADSLSEDPAPFSGRMDIVTGTALAGAGNFFTWFTQGSSGNEGYFANSYTTAYKTSDNGDVRAVRTKNLVGGAGFDIVVGTKSPTAGLGTIEIWQSNDAALPTFTQHSIYPPAGSIPGNTLHEVSCLRLVDLFNKGKPDLVIGTHERDYEGDLVILSGNEPAATDVFKHVFMKKLTGAVTGLAAGDYNGDNKKDIVLAIQTGNATGEVQFWKAKSVASSPDYQLDSTVTLPGIPISIVSADLGGDTKPDFAIGYRTTMFGYTGGVRIIYMDGGTPGAPVDPSGGTVTDMVPALNSNNFNYGVKPSLPPTPWLPDLAAGVKSSPTTGALIVFIR